MVFEANGGVVERRVEDTEFGLQIPFAVEIYEEFTGRFLGVDDNSHRFAGLIDQVTLSIERFDAKPEFPVTGGLELKLSIAGMSGSVIGGRAIGGSCLVFTDGGPRVP